jgi:hypothetical protein
MRPRESLRDFEYRVKRHSDKILSLKVAEQEAREAEEELKDLAHVNGMYVIVQSGKAVEIITPPEGFVAKEW